MYSISGDGIGNLPLTNNEKDGVFAILLRPSPRFDGSSGAGYGLLFQPRRSEGGAAQS